MELNGFKIVGVLPYIVAGRIDHYVILGQRTSDGECVTAKMWTLDDTSWNWGNYFLGEDALVEAYRDLHARAGAFTLTA